MLDKPRMKHDTQPEHSPAPYQPMLFSLKLKKEKQIDLKEKWISRKFEETWRKKCFWLEKCFKNACGALKWSKTCKKVLKSVNSARGRTFFRIIFLVSWKPKNIHLSTQASVLWGDAEIIAINSWTHSGGRFARLRPIIAVTWVLQRESATKRDDKHVYPFCCSETRLVVSVSSIVGFFRRIWWDGMSQTFQMNLMRRLNLQHGQLRQKVSKMRRLRRFSASIYVNPMPVSQLCFWFDNNYQG